MIFQILWKGHGSVKVRGKYKVEGNKILFFYEIPYGTNNRRHLLTEIGEVYAISKEIEGCGYPRWK